LWLIDRTLAENQGCQILLGTKYQNGEKIQDACKIYQMSITYFKQPLSHNPHDHKIPMPTFFYSKPLLNIPKLGFFGTKICHLATLLTMH
jgi:hypothetical protein